jgi:acetolactate synthase-1/2/3 large subunit
MTPAEIEAQALRHLGVPFVAGVPGSGPSYELLDRCERAGMEFVLTAHEAAGAIIAGAAARQRGTLGAALSIKGPGVANLVGGLSLCRFENYPVITFAEAYAPEAAAGLQHKRMNQDSVLSPLVKGVFYRGGPSIAQLAALARREPAGPVHMNLVAAPPVSIELEADVDDRLDAVLDRIAGSRRPVLICGSPLTRITPDSVRSAAITGLRLPVFTTAAGKGAIDEHDPASAGVFTNAGQSLAPEQSVLAAADLVIGVALRNVEVLGARPFAAPYISVDNAGGEFQQGFAPALHCRIDLGIAVPRLLDALRPVSWGLDAVSAAHARLAAHLDRDELLPAGCFATLSGVERAGLVTDSGNFTIVAEHVWRAARPLDFVGSSNGRFMGAGLPQALGVALADPSRPTLCTVGDGGLPPFVAELKLAIDRRLPLLVVLMTDGYYGSMRARVEAGGYTRSGIHVKRPAWHHVIGALGCDSVQVQDRSAFDAAVGAWTRSAPLFVEAVMPDRPYLEMVAPLRG